MRCLLSILVCVCAACSSEPPQPAAADESTGAETADAVPPQPAPAEPRASAPEAAAASEPGPAEVAPPSTQPSPEPTAAPPASAIAAEPQAPARPAAAPRSQASPPAGVSTSSPPSAASPPVAQPAAAPAVAAAPAAPQLGRVQVELVKLESDAGQVQAALFRTEAGFPDDPKKAAMRKVVKIQKRRVDLVFEDVAPGTFAVLVHHDENGDAKMQTGLFGMPAEGYGVSRDAPANFGPPSFEDARLKLAPGESKRIVIEMRY